MSNFFSGLWFPSKKFLDGDVLPKHTPDFFRLESVEQPLLLEYGELQSGLPRATKLMNGFEPVAAAYTQAKFTLFKKTDQNNIYPIALRMNLTDPTVARNCLRSRVRGELYFLPPEKYLQLDNYRENGVNFVRKRVSVVCTDCNRQGDPVVVRAWMYVGAPKVWGDQINWDLAYFGNVRKMAGKDYSLVSTYEDKNSKRYYHFTSQELNVQDRRAA